MKLSTKGRYGTRAMIDIALYKESGSTLLKDIASRQGISLKYLDHILSNLRKAGLIKNVRGKGGGYSLTRPAAQITLCEIIEAVEGTLAPVECVDNPDYCKKTSTCSAHDVWVKVRESIEDVLRKTSLQSLTESHEKKAGTPGTYTI
jgi:Rrf2 family transcriptional regulator, cysteine metabolism repressor